MDLIIAVNFDTFIVTIMIRIVFVIFVCSVDHFLR